MYRLTLVVCLFAVGQSALMCAADEIAAPKVELGQAKPLNSLALAATEPIVQILFTNPAGAKVYWDISKPGAYDSPGLSLPGRQNFLPNGLYRLRLTDLPGQKGVEFYPTIEIAPIGRLNKKFFSANAVPVQFTADDLDRARRGIVVTKVVYVPDEEFAELAIDGADTLVSFLLDPGVDPITEADRRGAILAVVRIHEFTLAKTPAEAAAENPNPGAAMATVSANSFTRSFDNRRRWFTRPGRVARESRRGWLWRR
jgi:hypothetical protein